MSALRQRMLDDMHLRGLAPKTQEAYVGAVRLLAAHYRKPPDQITEEDLRQYFLYLKDVKGVSRSTCTIALCAIKFFFERTLQRTWSTLDLVRPQREKKLPVVLSAAEVGRVLCGVHQPRYRVCLATIYACGLRLQEGVYLQVGDIDGGRYLPAKGVSGTAKATRIATCHCPNAAWRCCAITGAAIAIRSGSFQACAARHRRLRRRWT